MKRLTTTIALIAMSGFLSSCASTNTVKAIGETDKPIKASIERKVLDRLDILSADTWSEGDYEIYFPEMKSFSGYVVYSVEARDEQNSSTVDGCYRSSGKSLMFSCKVSVQDGDFIHRHNDIYISDRHIEELDDCIQDKEYDDNLWKKESYAYKMHFGDTCKEGEEDK